MKEKKTTVGILFGGMSGEHEVSIKSATAITKNLDRDKFIPLLIYINKKGQWRRVTESDLFTEKLTTGNFDSFIPWTVSSLENPDADIYFPVLHGPNGEDGKIQGLFEMAQKPYVGADSFSSALAMDKVVAKTLFRSAGLDTPDFLCFTKTKITEIQQGISEQLSYPVFVKPNALGSSVGISKVSQAAELKAAVDLAFSYDKKIIIEQGFPVREIEVSVLGNKNIMVSKPGELIPANDFYDYNDKYLDGQTQFIIPAKLEPKTEEKIRSMARKAYQTLFLNGMSRIDFFIINSNGRVLINEVNTIPGFTEISMYPKLWQVEGLSFQDLVTELIRLGFDYFRQTQSRDLHAE